MRKTLILVLTTVLFIGCEVWTYDKPWIIVGKHPNSGLCSEGYCRYEYRTANHRNISFCEDENKYNIGDTIQ